MSKEILYDYDPITPEQITREEYTNVGSGLFKLGDAARGFQGSTDFEIWDSLTGGTQLVENTDYEILNIDDRNSPKAGFDIYTKVRILNPTYQTGSIYITYKAVLSYVDSEFYNSLYSSASKEVVYITNADSPYTVTDSTIKLVMYCDTSGGNIDINLPTLADNQDREIEIYHQVGGGLLTIDGESAETIDGLQQIELPKQSDRLGIIASSLEWAITSEKISCQLVLDTYAGHGITDTTVVQFSNTIDNYGNMFSENHSTGYNGLTEGLNITIQKAGRYGFSFSANAPIGGNRVGITIGEPTPINQNVNAIAVRPYRRALDSTPTDDFENSVDWEAKCEVGEIIRPRDIGGVPVTVDNYHFTATYLG